MWHRASNPPTETGDYIARFPRGFCVIVEYNAELKGWNVSDEERRNEFTDVEWWTDIPPFERVNVEHPVVKEIERNGYPWWAQDECSAEEETEPYEPSVADVFDWMIALMGIDHDDYIEQHAPVVEFLKVAKQELSESAKCRAAVLALNFGERYKDEIDEYINS